MADAEVNAIDNLVSARNFLNTNLENSRALSSALQKTEQRLKAINLRLPTLEAASNPNFTIKDQIDLAIGPAIAVLKICNAIQELQKSLLSATPRSDLSGYLLLVKQLEQAFKFLAANCGLAIQWLQAILQFIKDNNDLYVFKVNKCLSILQKLQATEEKSRLSGGILFAVLDKIETEFKQLLTENCFPVAFPFLSSSSSGDKQASPLPVAVAEKLQSIISILKANKRLHKCISAYVEIRSNNARTSLQGLDLNYLDNSVSELEDVQDIEGFIDQWCRHLELAVKYVFESEFELFNNIFGTETRVGCFAKIATQSGILSFLRFGLRVTECKKDPVKLLKLLDIFSCLDKLRADFNRLFIGIACTEIQNLTRDLIRKVVYGACEIFWELPLQVRLQRKNYCPLSDGSVPRLVSFVTDYCNHLLGDNYKPLLIKVLTIYQSWKNEKYHDTIITNQMHCVIKEIGVNLDTLSKAHEDMALCYLFMMNNHCHFSDLKGTKIGELMGDYWVKAHEQYKDYYMTLYLRETWGKILALLSYQHAQNRNDYFVKKILKEFTEALDGMYEKQSTWVVPNEKLRLKICRVAAKAFVPVYRSYLQNYSHLAQEDVKYTAQGLESLLSSLFQPNIRMYSNNIQIQWTHQVKNIDSVHHFHHLTLMAG